MLPSLIFQVEVKKAIPKGDKLEESNEHSSNRVGDDNTEINTKKIFVGGLPLDIKEEEFKSYFESFGTVTDAPVICDKETGRPRGFGFITFDSEDAVNNVLQTRFHKLKYKMVEVKRSHPKDRIDKFMNCYVCNNSNFGFGFGGGFSYGYDGLFYFYPAFQIHQCYGSPSAGRGGLLVPASPVCPSYGLCMNGYCNGIDSCHQMAESTADGSNSTGDHASGLEAPATRKLSHIDDVSSLKVGAVTVEHQRAGVEFHDSTVLPSTKCKQTGTVSTHIIFSEFSVSSIGSFWPSLVLVQKPSHL